MRDLKGRPHQAAFSVCDVPSADCETAPSTSPDRKHPGARKPTGYRRTPSGSSNWCFAPAIRPRISSTRSGCCGTLCWWAN